MALSWNIDKDLYINEDSLDIEWLNQPRIFMKYAKAAAQAELKAKQISEKVKTLRSQLIQKVNENPGKTTNKSKPNAQDTEAYYRTNPDYIETKKQLIQAEFDSSLLWNAVSAFHQRKLSLENLVRLHGQQYFAGPSVPRNLAQKVQDKEALLQKQQQEADNKVKHSMIRKHK